MAIAYSIVLDCEQCDVDTAFLYKIRKEHTVNHVFWYVVKLIDKQVELEYHLSLLVKRSSINRQMACERALLDWLSYFSLLGSDNSAGNLQTLCEEA